MRESGRASRLSLKLLPIVRWVRERGREVRALVKEKPERVRWVRERGREGTSWLNSCPKVRCVIEGGRKFTSWLK